VAARRAGQAAPPGALLEVETNLPDPGIGMPPTGGGRIDAPRPRA